MAHPKTPKDSSTVQSCLENYLHENERHERNIKIIEAAQLAVKSVLMRKNLAQMSISPLMQNALRLKMSTFVLEAVTNKLSQGDLERAALHFATQLSKLVFGSRLGLRKIMTQAVA